MASKERLADAWQTANLCGVAFAGKLRKLSYYMDQLRQNKVKKAPQISMDEFEERLKKAMEGGRGNGN